MTTQLGEADARNQGANLIIHHGIADVLDQAAKLVCILDAVHEPRDPASHFQRDEILKNVFKFPGWNARQAGH